MILQEPTLMSSGLREHTHAPQIHIHRHVCTQDVPSLAANAWYMLYNTCQIFLRDIAVIGFQKISLWYSLKKSITRVNRAQSVGAEVTLRQKSS